MGKPMTSTPGRKARRKEPTLTDQPAIPRFRGRERRDATEPLQLTLIAKDATGGVPVTRITVYFPRPQPAP